MEVTPSAELFLHANLLVGRGYIMIVAQIPEIHALHSFDITIELQGQVSLCQGTKLQHLYL